MRQRISKYLTISKKEWNGMVVLLVAILLVLAAPYVYKRLHKDKAINFKDFDKAAVLLKSKAAVSNDSFARNSGAGYAPNKLAPGEQVEINSADSAMLTRIRGIGPSFARRIVTYRKRLGGFVATDQLKEVYGLDAEKFKQIAPQVYVNTKTSPVNVMRINVIELEGLLKCPYLSYKQANAIIQYRIQHGNYSSIADMRDIAILNDNILRKIAPYITFK